MRTKTIASTNMAQTNTTTSVEVTRWISVQADGGDRWLFDAEFMTSNWRCIYGCGCKGIEADPVDNSDRGCCSYGAHFSDDGDLDRVLQAVERLTPDLWHNYEAVRNWEHDLAEDLTERDDEGDRVSRVVDGACIFNNPSGVSSPAGCAFHHLATADGVDHLTYKPEVCWQVPLRVDHHEDDHGLETHLVRQWTLHDWGGADTGIGWWCDDDDRAYSGDVPVAVSLRAEIAALAGPEVADALIESVLESPVVIQPRN